MTSFLLTILTMLLASFCVGVYVDSVVTSWPLLTYLFPLTAIALILSSWRALAQKNDFQTAVVAANATASAMILNTEFTKQAALAVVGPGIIPALAPVGIFVGVTGVVVGSAAALRIIKCRQKPTATLPR